jgi:hypothetical protein
MAALAAGLGRPVQIRPDGIERKLYDYARERKFPPAETLARKAAELAGGDYPYPSLAAAPEPERVFFTAFRTVAEALEPFHEDDDPNAAHDEAQLASADTDGIQTPTLADLLAEAGCKNAVDLVDMAKVGNSLMASIEIYTKAGEVLEGWSPAEDPAEVIGDLVDMVETAEAARDKLQDQVLELTKAPPPQEQDEDPDKKKAADQADDDNNKKKSK